MNEKSDDEFLREWLWVTFWPLQVSLFSSLTVAASVGVGIFTPNTVIDAT